MVLMVPKGLYATLTELVKSCCRHYLPKYISKWARWMQLAMCFLPPHVKNQIHCIGETTLKNQWEKYKWGSVII